MLDRILKFYGSLGQEEKNYILQKSGELSENEKQKYCKSLFNDCPARTGIPTVETLEEVYKRITGQGEAVYYWAVCKECGGEYDYSLLICPFCYKKGFECRARDIKTSKEQPPAKVVKYNKGFYKIAKEKTCYDCKDNYLSYCEHFGLPRYECKEFRDCKCNACCALHRKKNLEIEADRSNSKDSFSYAIPLKKGE